MDEINEYHIPHSLTEITKATSLKITKISVFDDDKRNKLKKTSRSVTLTNVLQPVLMAI